MFLFLGQPEFLYHSSKMKRNGDNSEKLQIPNENFQNLHPKSGLVSWLGEEPDFPLR